MSLDPGVILRCRAALERSAREPDWWPVPMQREDIRALLKACGADDAPPSNWWVIGAIAFAEAKRSEQAAQQSDAGRFGYAANWWA